MKLDLLKKLIKEAVKEAVREELETILSEDVKPKSTPMGVAGKGTLSTVTKYENYKPVTVKPVSTGDPIVDLLNETRATMTSTPGLGLESMMEDHFTRPEVGIDLSQLDFVKNAGAIFKASVEKDKQRLGA